MLHINFLRLAHALKVAWRSRVIPVSVKNITIITHVISKIGYLLKLRLFLLTMSTSTCRCKKRPCNTHRDPPQSDIGSTGLKIIWKRVKKNKTNENKNEFRSNPNSILYFKFNFIQSEQSNWSNSQRENLQRSWIL